MCRVNGVFSPSDLLIEDGRVVSVLPGGSAAFEDFFVFNFSDKYLFPGFIDVHVHLREPGYEYKETIGSGTAAAAAGGYTDVCSMPNLNPAPSDAESLRRQLELIKESAVIRVHPYARITHDGRPGELADFDSLSVNAIGFTDDGKGVQSEDLMLSAMQKAKTLGSIIAAHCEDESLLNGGCIHDGDYAKKHGCPGISSESEWRQLARDLRLAKQTGCKYHVCHVSCAESVELIRRAKSDGVDVTCETAPHYLLLDDSRLQDDGRFKMNPPLRSERDRKALLSGITDGTIDVIATDHAPHSASEKSGGLRNSLNGIVGLETAFPMLFTGLVKTGLIDLDGLLKLMHHAPAKRFDIGSPLELDLAASGRPCPADFTVFDLSHEYTITPSAFLSKGKSTPFEGEKAFGKCLATFINGEPAFLAQSPERK